MKINKNLYPVHNDVFNVPALKGLIVSSEFPSHS